MIPLWTGILLLINGKNVISISDNLDKRSLKVQICFSPPAMFSCPRSGAGLVWVGIMWEEVEAKTGLGPVMGLGTALGSQSEERQVVSRLYLLPSHPDRKPEAYCC